MSEGKCEFLNRPQCSQRGDLSLGESFHSCDIEPFVRTVAPQRSQPLAALEIPHVDGAVIAAASQSPAIGADPEGLDRPLMPLINPHTLPTLYVPPAEHSGAIPTDHQLSTLAAGSPVLPVEACGNRPGGIKGLGKDGVTERGPRQGGILHLDPLQICPLQG